MNARDTDAKADAVLADFQARERAEGFYLARRDNRWDVYPQDDPPVLVHVERRGGFAVIRCASYGFVFPCPMVLLEQAHGVAAPGKPVQS